ncbi:MAG: cytochrome C oxidase subunit IV family protein [Bryobacterales bacterium]|nr:cytochrome C oxidase subunit IV family protein [Bryobacterales bacterium]
MTHSIVPAKVYVGVWAVLIALTFTTVAVSKLELGEYNFIAAMTIAVIKATLVVMFFMNLKHSSSMVRLFVVAGLFWLAIMFVFVLSDYFSRGWLPIGQWW